jgi:uncharacterized 2Fe-2S/4Fe-4S cluster protein (DUF4445 family)
MSTPKTQSRSASSPTCQDRIFKVGNASLEGATIMLLSGPKRAEIQEFVKHIQHVELETTPDFFEFFVEGCQFKPMAEPPPKPAATPTRTA